MRVRFLEVLHGRQKPERDFLESGLQRGTVLHFVPECLFHAVSKDGRIFYVWHNVYNLSHRGEHVDLHLVGSPRMIQEVSAP